MTDRIERLLNAGAEIQREVWGDVRFSHSLLCSVNLPYRNPTDAVRSYTRSSGPVSLLREAGKVFTPSGWVDVGLPYGAKSRLLLLHLCSLAVKQQSPIVEVADSFTAFCRDLGIDTNGRNLRIIKDQIRRMSAVSMRLGLQQGGELVVFQGSIFDGVRVEVTSDWRQMPMWTNEIRFSPRFYESLKNHAVPLDARALKAIRHSARSIDIYLWLCSRLWRVPAGKPQKIRWTSLKHQFGQPSQSLKSFKAAFSTALRQVLVVYPTAQVEPVWGGIELRRSPPAIPMKD